MCGQATWGCGLRLWADSRLPPQFTHFDKAAPKWEGIRGGLWILLTLRGLGSRSFIGLEFKWDPCLCPQIRLQPRWGRGTEDQLSHDQTPQFWPTETFLQYTFCYLKVTKFAVTYYTTIDNWCKSEDTNYDNRHESGDTTTGYYSPFNDNKGTSWTTLCFCNWHPGWNGQIPSDKTAKLTQEDNLGRTFKMVE